MTVSLGQRIRVCSDSCVCPAGRRARGGGGGAGGVGRRRLCRARRVLLRGRGPAQRLPGPGRPRRRPAPGRCARCAAPARAGAPGTSEGLPPPDSPWHACPQLCSAGGMVPAGWAAAAARHQHAGLGQGCGAPASPQHSVLVAGGCHSPCCWYQASSAAGRWSTCMTATRRNLLQSMMRRVSSCSQVNVRTQRIGPWWPLCAQQLPDLAARRARRRGAVRRAPGRGRRRGGRARAGAAGGGAAPGAPRARPAAGLPPGAGRRRARRRRRRRRRPRAVPRGRASLLDALQPHVIDPAARPVLPPDIFSTHDAADGPAAAHQPAGAAAAGAAVGGAGGGAAAPAGASAPRRGRPPMPLPADLLPALAAFLLAHPELRAVAKVAQASSRAPAFAPSRWREQSLDLCGSPGCAALCVLARQGALGSSLRSLRRLMRSLRCRRSARRTRSAS